MQQRRRRDTHHPDEDVARLARFLRTKGGRLTGERISLLQAICSMESHFRPEQLAERMLRLGHPVSVPTVYRSLPVLVEAGIVRRACREEEAGGGAVYEHVWGHPHHDHMVCMQCGKTVEFSYPAIEVLQDAVAREHGFELVRHHLELVGLCADCRQEQPKSMEDAG